MNKHAIHHKRGYERNPVAPFKPESKWLQGFFEVLSEFSLRMKQQYRHAVLVSCANGYQGYLPFAHEYERGGYEASERSTHFEPGTADRLMELVTNRLRRM